jgi:hypothetical protein
MQSFHGRYEEGKTETTDRLGGDADVSGGDIGIGPLDTWQRLTRSPSLRPAQTRTISFGIAARTAMSTGNGC